MNQNQSPSTLRTHAHAINRKSLEVSKKKSLEKMILESFCLKHRLCVHVRKNVQVGNDQEKAQKRKRFPLEKKTKLTIRYLYHENAS